MQRTIELEVLPACRRYGIGLIPWSPLAGGLLGGALGKVSEGRAVARSYVQGRIEQRARRSSSGGSSCARSSASDRPTSRSRGCCTNPAVTAPDHRPAHRWSS